MLLSGKVCYPWDFCETRNYDDEKWGSTTTTITKKKKKIFCSGYNCNWKLFWSHKNTRKRLRTFWEISSLIADFSDNRDGSLLHCIVGYSYRKMASFLITLLNVNFAPFKIFSRPLCKTAVVVVGFLQCIHFFSAFFKSSLDFKENVRAFIYDHVNDSFDATGGIPIKPHCSNHLRNLVSHCAKFLLGWF